MLYADFDGTPAGRLVPTEAGARAFVPHPLPPPLDLGSIALALGEAQGAVGELRGAYRRLVNPTILIRPLQRLEAQTSSAMEGTHTTNEELALAEAGIEKNPASEAQEVINYLQALLWAERELQRLPISGRLIRGAHERLMRRVGRSRGQDRQPGEYKRLQNMIGGRDLRSARFIPPPPAEAVRAMSDLESYINRPDKGGSSPLIDMALVHYQFETIHPFADGNGRVGRMLISLMAVSEGLLPQPILYMSPELEDEKDAYIELMYAVSARGEWTAWIAFFLDVMARSAKATVGTIDRVLALQADYQRRVAAVGRSVNLMRAVDMLFDTPILSAKQVSAKLQVTDVTARSVLRQLTQADIVKERTWSHPTTWRAEEILSLSEPRH